MDHNWKRRHVGCGPQACLHIRIRTGVFKQTPMAAWSTDPFQKPGGGTLATVVSLFLLGLSMRDMDLWLSVMRASGNSWSLGRKSKGYQTWAGKDCLSPLAAQIASISGQTSHKYTLDIALLNEADTEIRIWGTVPAASTLPALDRGSFRVVWDREGWRRDLPELSNAKLVGFIL